MKMTNRTARLNDRLTELEKELERTIHAIKTIADDADETMTDAAEYTADPEERATLLTLRRRAKNVNGLSRKMHAQTLDY